MANLDVAVETLPQVPAWAEKSHPNMQQLMADALAGKSHRERWKYTAPSKVMDLVTQTGERPNWGDLPEGVSHEQFLHSRTDAPFMRSMDAVAPDSAPLAWIGLCHQSQIDLLTVTSDASIDLSHSGTTTPLLIRVATNTRLTLNEQFEDGSSAQQTLWLELEPGSQVIHSRNNFGAQAQWQYLQVLVNRDATYTLHNHSLGSPLRRQDIHVVCAESGAHANLLSAAYVEAGQHLDQQVTLEHQAAHTTSEQAFHNIAANKAKVTFNGRIHIHPNAPQVDAQLANKNLAVGEQATINTKPELEIYTDDVKCAHGATVGQLDPEHVFYAASRGIDPQQARQLLAQAFLNVCTAGPLAEQASLRFGALAHD